MTVFLPTWPGLLILLHPCACTYVPDMNKTQGRTALAVPQVAAKLTQATRDSGRASLHCTCARVANSIPLAFVRPNLPRLVRPSDPYSMCLFRSGQMYRALTCVRSVYIIASVAFMQGSIYLPTVYSRRRCFLARPIYVLQ
jgi:hypothetical protein